MNPLDLHAKTILLTGGAGAIGRVVTTQLLEFGARVIVNDTLEEAAVRALFPPSARLHYHRADITNAEAVSDLYDSLEAREILPDTVLCHAGMTHSAPLADYPIEAFDALIQLNVRGSFLVAQEAFTRWNKREMPGHLVFTSSWVQDVPWPEITPYNASKAAVRMLMRGFAREGAPRVRANAVAPGIVGVGLAKNQWDNDRSYRQRAKRAIPLGTLQTPESVADALLFLCSDLARYMTGSTLLVDGGCSLYPMDDDDQEAS